MLDCIVTALSGLAAGIAIGAGPALVYRASWLATRADAERMRARLVLASRRESPSAANWSALGCPALAPPGRSANVVALAARRIPIAPVIVADRSA